MCIYVYTYIHHVCNLTVTNVASGPDHLGVDSVLDRSGVDSDLITILRLLLLLLLLILTLTLLLIKLPLIQFS